MSRERSEAAAMSDMLQAAEAVLRHVAGKSCEDYEREELVRHAVERNIEIIGEAARRLTDEFRRAHPDIPWRAIMATRHILAHEYDEVDNDIVWRIITDHIPVLPRKMAISFEPSPS